MGKLKKKLKEIYEWIVALAIAGGLSMIPVCTLVGFFWIIGRIFEVLGI